MGGERLTLPPRPRVHDVSQVTPSVAPRKGKPRPPWNPWGFFGDRRGNTGIRTRFQAELVFRFSPDITADFSLAFPIDPGVSAAPPPLQSWTGKGGWFPITLQSYNPPVKVVKHFGTFLWEKYSIIIHTWFDILLLRDWTFAGWLLLRGWTYTGWLCHYFSVQADYSPTSRVWPSVLCDFQDKILEFNTAAFCSLEFAKQNLEYLNRLSFRNPGLFSWFSVLFGFRNKPLSTLSRSFP